MALALPSLPQRRGEEDGKSAHTRGISLRIAEDGRHGGYGCSGHPTEVSQDMRLVSDLNNAAARSMRPPPDRSQKHVSIASSLADALCCLGLQSRQTYSTNQRSPKRRSILKHTTTPRLLIRDEVPPSCCGPIPLRCVACNRVFLRPVSISVYSPLCPSRDSYSDSTAAEQSIHG